MIANDKDLLKVIVLAGLALIVNSAGCTKNEGQNISGQAAVENAGQAKGGTAQDMLAKAVELSRQGKNAEAVELCDKMLSEYPTGSQNSGSTSHQAAEFLNQIGEYGRAISISEEIQKNNPQDIWSLRIIAESYRLQGKYREAKEQLKKVLDAASTMNSTDDMAAAYCNMATIDKQENNIVGAKKNIEQAIKLMPSNQYFQDFLGSLNKEQ